MNKAVSTLLSLTLVLFLACRNERSAPGDATTGTATADTATATHPASPGGTAIVPDVDAGTTVVVVINDNSIAVRGQQIPPGPAVLTIENAGTKVHNLFIEGAGISRAAGDTIPAGESRTLDVTFQNGEYTFYCPVLNHREDFGEEVKVTVGAT